MSVLRVMHGLLVDRNIRTKARLPAFQDLLKLATKVVRGAEYTPAHLSNNKPYELHLYLLPCAPLLKDLGASVCRTFREARAVDSRS